MAGAGAVADEEAEKRKLVARGMAGGGLPGGGMPGVGLTVAAALGGGAEATSAVGGRVEVAALNGADAACRPSSSSSLL